MLGWRSKKTPINKQKQSGFSRLFQPIEEKLISFEKKYDFNTLEMLQNLDADRIEKFLTSRNEYKIIKSLRFQNRLNKWNINKNDLDKYQEKTVLLNYDNCKINPKFYSLDTKNKVFSTLSIQDKFLNVPFDAKTYLMSGAISLHPNKNHAIINIELPNNNLNSQEIEQKVEEKQSIITNEKSKHFGVNVSVVYEDFLSFLDTKYKIGDQLVKWALKNKLATDEKKAYDILFEYLQLIHSDNVSVLLNSLPQELHTNDNNISLVISALLAFVILSFKPEIIVLDNLTNLFDSSNLYLLLNIIEKVKNTTHTTIVFASQDLNLIYAQADYISVIFNGEVIEEGTKEEILFFPQHPYTWSFLFSSQKEAYSKILSSTNWPHFWRENGFNIKNIKTHKGYYLLSNTHKVLPISINANTDISLEIQNEVKSVWLKYFNNNQEIYNEYLNNKYKLLEPIINLEIEENIYEDQITKELRWVKNNYVSSLDWETIFKQKAFKRTFNENNSHNIKSTNKELENNHHNLNANRKPNDQYYGDNYDTLFELEDILNENISINILNEVNDPIYFSKTLKINSAPYDIMEPLISLQTIEFQAKEEFTKIPIRDHLIEDIKTLQLIIDPQTKKDFNNFNLKEGQFENQFNNTTSPEEISPSIVNSFAEKIVQEKNEVNLLEEQLINKEPKKEEQINNLDNLFNEGIYTKKFNTLSGVEKEIKIENATKLAILPLETFLIDMPNIQEAKQNNTNVIMISQTDTKELDVEKEVISETVKPFAIEKTKDNQHPIIELKELENNITKEDINIVSDVQVINEIKTLENQIKETPVILEDKEDNTKSEVEPKEEMQQDLDIEPKEKIEPTVEENIDIDLTTKEENIIEHVEETIVPEEKNENNVEEQLEIEKETLVIDDLAQKDNDIEPKVAEDIIDNTFNNEVIKLKGSSSNKVKFKLKDKKIKVKVKPTPIIVKEEPKLEPKPEPKPEPIVEIIEVVNKVDEPIIVEEKQPIKEEPIVQKEESIEPILVEEPKEEIILEPAKVEEKEIVFIKQVEPVYDPIYISEIDLANFETYGNELGELQFIENKFQK